MRTKWLLIGIALLTAIAIGAVACGDDEDNGDNGNGEVATDVVDDGDGAVATDVIDDGDDADDGDDMTGVASLIATANSELGDILTDGEGNTVYVFASDDPGVSNCAGGCAELWPPLTSDDEPSVGDGVTGVVALIEREDGSMQVTYDGMPLYYFDNDTAPGDTNGQGVGDVWFVVEISG